MLGPRAAGIHRIPAAGVHHSMAPTVRVQTASFAMDRKGPARNARPVYSPCSPTPIATIVRSPAGAPYRTCFKRPHFNRHRASLTIKVASNFWRDRYRIDPGRRRKIRMQARGSIDPAVSLSLSPLQAKSLRARGRAAQRQRLHFPGRNGCEDFPEGAGSAV